jgi:hypothetical protein
VIGVICWLRRAHSFSSFESMGDLPPFRLMGEREIDRYRGQSGVGSEAGRDR